MANKNILILLNGYSCCPLQGGDSVVVVVVVVVVIVSSSFVFAPFERVHRLSLLPLSVEVFMGGSRNFVSEGGGVLTTFF